MVNKTVGFNGRLFCHSAQPTSATPVSAAATPSESASTYDPLARPDKKKVQTGEAATDKDLEGYDDDPLLTRVVDRRWYERNKHIYPASTWEDFDPTKDYTKGIRKDTEGNAFFFS